MSNSKDLTVEDIISKLTTIFRNRMPPNYELVSVAKRNYSMIDITIRNITVDPSLSQAVLRLQVKFKRGKTINLKETDIVKPKFDEEVFIGDILPDILVDIMSEAFLFYSLHNLGRYESIGAAAPGLYAIRDAAEHRYWVWVEPCQPNSIDTQLGKETMEDKQDPQNAPEMAETLHVWDMTLGDILNVAYRLVEILKEKYKSTPIEFIPTVNTRTILINAKLMDTDTFIELGLHGIPTFEGLLHQLIVRVHDIVSDFDTYVRPHPEAMPTEALMAKLTTNNGILVSMPMFPITNLASQVKPLLPEVAGIGYAATEQALVVWMKNGQVVIRQLDRLHRQTINEFIMVINELTKRSDNSNPTDTKRIETLEAEVNQLKQVVASMSGAGNPWMNNFSVGNGVQGGPAPNHQYQGQQRSNTVQLPIKTIYRTGQNQFTVTLEQGPSFTIDNYCYGIFCSNIVR